MRKAFTLIDPRLSSSPMRLRRKSRRLSSRVFVAAVPRDDKRFSGFTLIELLVVIAILAVLAVVVVLTLNPAGLMQESRDSTRLSDIASLNNGIAAFTGDVQVTNALGQSKVLYVSIPDQTLSGTQTSTCTALGLPALPTGWNYQCASSQSYRLTNGNGWIPINFTQASFGTPFSELPIDPINVTSSGLYYTYATNGSQYEVTSIFESSKYKLQYGTNLLDPDYPEVNAKGSSLSISPLWNPNGLIGYWPFDEGSGSSTIDQSNSGNNGVWQNAPTPNSQDYKAGKVGPYAGFFGYFPGTAYNEVSLASATFNAQPFSLAAWVNDTGTNGTIMYFSCSGTTNQCLQFDITSALIPSIDFGNDSKLAPSAIPANTWAYVVTTWGGPATSRIIYVNGIAVASDTPGTLVVSTGTTNIGNGAYPNGNSLDDLRLYNRALSPAEIQALYNGEK